MTIEPPAGPVPSRRISPSNRPPISVALVNNMPDAALRATERQFRYLVARSTRAHDVDLQIYYMPDVIRGEAGERHCRTHYRPIDALLRGTTDALIVTGCEPRAPSLRDEAFWNGFTKLVDWARDNTRSALWSCLAAHAAVLHLDGIERHRLPGKLSGVFTCDRTRHHPLLAGLPETLRVPHSRLNTLRTDDLVADGYQILTRSSRVGPDMFVKAMPSLFVFLQGHPEYECDSLGREFRRDLDRFVAGTSATAPVPPEAYFDRQVADRLAATAADANRGVRLGKDELASIRELLASTPSADWRAPAVQVYRNWLGFVADLRQRDATSREQEPMRLAG